MFDLKVNEFATMTVNVSSGVPTVPFTWIVEPTDNNELAVMEDGMSATIRQLSAGVATVTVSDETDKAAPVMVDFNFVAEPVVFTVDTVVTPV